MKRFFDFVVSVAMLLALMPGLLVIAFAIVLDSGMPFLHSQERIGRHFLPFRLWKFRTMKAGARGLPITVSGDERITRIGRFLRRTKLDELPQLWNVARGDMSLVGPRPEVRTFVDMFSHRYRSVLAVRPGITDMASVVFRDEEALLRASSDPLAFYAREVLPAKLSLAEHYVQTRSFGRDVSILCKTARALVSHR